MEPKLPSPDRGPEFRPPVPSPGGEGMSASPDYESRLEKSPERTEFRNEASSPVQSSTPSITVLPVPSLPLPADDTTAVQSQAQDDNPLVADDKELIEKEWVDKAKKVIAETKDDPYRREQEVAKLQADYLYKRYGRKLGSPQ